MQGVILCFHFLCSFQTSQHMPGVIYSKSIFIVIPCGNIHNKNVYCVVKHIKSCLRICDIFLWW